MSGSHILSVHSSRRNLVEVSKDRKRGRSLGHSGISSTYLEDFVQEKCTQCYDAHREIPHIISHCTR